MDRIVDRIRGRDVTRIACCIPGCRRTRRNEHGWAEWICGKHWSLIPRPLRRVHGRLQRLMRRGYGAGEVSARAGRVWGRLRRAAFERAL